MITVACSEHFCGAWSGLNPFNGTAASHFYNKLIQSLISPRS